jgi:hypothetical protein
MTQDRQLEIDIAEKLMGWVRVGNRWNFPDPDGVGYTVVGVRGDAFDYASTWNGMRAVIERMCELGYCLNLYSECFEGKVQWCAEFTQYDGEMCRLVIVAYAYAVTAPEAVAKAALEALAALGGERDVDTSRG